jgi:hypothetical protein
MMLADNAGMHETLPPLPVETNRRRSLGDDGAAELDTTDGSKSWLTQPRTQILHRTADRALGPLSKHALS